MAEILSFDEQCCYVKEETPVARKDHQEWLIDLGGLFPRSEANALWLADNRIPRVRQAYPNVPGMYCIKSDVVQEKDVPNVWRLSVDWSTPTNAQDTIADPTERPIIIRTGTYREQKTPAIDFDGKPVATTAGEPILHTIQRSYPTFICQKFLKTYPKFFAKDRDFVNKDSVTIYGQVFKPYELFCPDIQVSELVTQGQYSYFDFNSTIYVNTDEFGWRTRLRNAGYHERRLVKMIRNPAIPPGTGNNVFQLPLMIPQYAFEAIRMGYPGNYSYPSSPVLLTPEGRAYREVTESDKVAAPAGQAPVGTGPVIGLQAGEHPAQGTAITQEQWDKAVVELTFVNVVSFNQFFPLR